MAMLNSGFYGNATKVLYNGSFLGFPEADALVLEGDCIRAVGTAGELLEWWPEADGTTWIDLAGRFVVPGFIDSHIHLLDTGLVESGWRVDLMGLSRADTVEALAQAVRDRDDEWVVGYGWDESRWVDRRYLHRTELDGIAPNSPVLAVRLDGHLLTANCAALARVPDSAPANLIERDTGWVRELAATEMRRVVRPDRGALVKALDAAASLCHRLGITTVHTMMSLDFFNALLQERRERRLRIRVCPEIESFDKLLSVGLESGFGDAWLRFGGVKVFADGSIGAGNAAVTEPFRNGSVGQLNHTTTQLQAWVEMAERSGWQTVIHAIGDRAIEQVLQVHEAVKTDPSFRHRIEHFELPLLPQIERVKNRGLALSMQPNFTANWSGAGSMYEDRLGAERDELSNPLLLIHRAGIPLAFGSDGMPPSPLYGLHGAVNGPYPQQRLPIDVAMTAYTAGGALLGFEEAEKGSLDPGKLADVVVLDEDPRLNPEDVRHRQVEMTFVGGDLVYRRSSQNGNEEE